MIYFYSTRSIISALNLHLFDNQYLLLPLLTINHYIIPFTYDKIKSFFYDFQFCVKSVLNSARVPYQRGIELEQEYFQDLRSSSQSKGMRYAFFAERAITKV